VIARPLIVMTPKGLLRLKGASSTLVELSTGSFRPVLDDDANAVSFVQYLVGSLCWEERAAPPYRRA
jgi:2-oxoglutarate dehydrogenase E1 component